jgi:uncharacterized membrane protein YkgB
VCSANDPPVTSDAAKHPLDIEATAHVDRSRASSKRISEAISVVEVTVAVFIALRRWSPTLALVGGTLGIVMCLTTLSFIVTTPNVGDGAAF